jgi:hypothetical protein
MVHEREFITLQAAVMRENQAQVEVEEKAGSKLK